MQFKSRDSIYSQISERMIEAIISGSWPEEERIPSIREMAMQMQVNPNTVSKSFTLLQEREIIYNRRGIGYFVAPGAKKGALKMKKDEFVAEILPELFGSMSVIGITPGELAALFESYLTDTNRMSASAAL